MAILYEDKYFSSDGGVWQVRKKKGAYAIVEGFKKGKRLILLVEGLEYDGTTMRWQRQAAYTSLDAAERDLQVRAATPKQVAPRTTFVKGRRI